MTYPPPYPPQPPSRPPAGMPNFPQHTPPPVPVQQFQNGYGVSGFVLGLLALLFCWIPILGVVAWILAPLALVFCILGLSRVNKGIANNAGLAWTGIVLAGIALLVCFLWLSVFGTDAARKTPASASSTGITQSISPNVATTPAFTPPIPSGPLTQVSDGDYEVGVDMAPGKYKTPGPDTQGNILDSCYWGRSRNDSGELRSIIANDNITGQSTVTVKAGEVFNATGGCTWTKVG